MSKIQLTKPVARELSMTTGVRIPHKKLEIEFQYNNKRCRETLKLPITVPGIRAAALERQKVLDAIEAGTFVYSKFFPNSSKAMQFDEGTGKIRNMEQAMEKFLKLRAATKAPSTVLNDRKKVNAHIIPMWGDRFMHQIKPTEVEEWYFELLDGTAKTCQKPLKAKTANEILSLLSQCFDIAVRDEVASRNIVSLVKKVRPQPKKDEDIRPFTLDELRQLDATPTHRESEKNMLLFNCWVGLSASELCALAWEDIDFDNWTARINRALVAGEFKCPKERSRVRTVDIPEPARKYLIAQKAISMVHPAETVTVRQFDGRTLEQDSIRVIFVNSGTHYAWDQPANVNLRFMHDFLAKAGVEYRPINQSRHTFASRMLTMDMDRNWIIRQLGHTDFTMLNKHYGKYIDSEHVNRSDEVARRLAELEGQGS